MTGQPSPDDINRSLHRIPRGGAGVAGIWCRAGHVLMTRRAKGIPYPDVWCFPGGGIEAGEDEIAALKREWQEELGIGIEPVRRIASVEISNAAGRFPLHCYLVTSNEDEFRPNPLEVAEVRWIPVAGLLDLPDLIRSNRKLLVSLGPDLHQAFDAGCRPDNISSGSSPCFEASAESPASSDSGPQPGPGSPCTAPPSGGLFTSDKSGGPVQADTANVVRSSGWRVDLRRHLDALCDTSMHRRLRTVESPMGRTIRLESGREILNFAGNDYLGLAADPRIARVIAEAASRWGWGAGGSQLVCGHTQLHAELEQALARFKAVEATLVLPTGYMANLAAIRALAAPGDVILLDKLNHASIIDASSSCGAEVRIFPHRHYDRLERLLQRYGKARRRLIVTDTVFSMDGDLADLPRLATLKKQYDAILLIDEAHATGVLGPTGRGLAELQGVEHEIDVTIGTLSKAFGGLGGFVAGSGVLIEALVNLARPFIFTTGLPAAACAAAIEALRISQSEPWRRQKVLDLAHRLRGWLGEGGWDPSFSETQIIPCLVGSADRAMRLSERLLEEGIFVPAIRPPAVAPGAARLRFSVSAAHELADVEFLVRGLARASHA